MSARDAFVERCQPRWRELELLLDDAARSAEDWSRLASLYRGVCADLARAQGLALPADVLRYLDGLASRAHNQLYGVRTAGGRGLIRTVASGFPRELRRQWRFFAAASLLFYGPLVVGIVGALVDPGFAGQVLPEPTLANVEAMYSDADLARGGTEDAGMAGFYVYNNIGIAFRCFATGALAGLGSVFYLVYNGLLIGTIAGYLGSVGLGGNLLAFVAGHSAWELTGVVVAGAGGLRMGWALLVTDGRTRAGSVRAAGPALYRLVLGAAALLAVAALIEGFWSAGPMPVPVKHAFGLAQVAIVGSWLLLGGRGEDG